MKGIRLKERRTAGGATAISDYSQVNPHWKDLKDLSKGLEGTESAKALSRGVAGVFKDRQWLSVLGVEWVTGNTISSSCTAGVSKLPVL